MGFRLADADSDRWFLRPALIAAAGVIAVAVAIGINVARWHADEEAKELAAQIPTQPMLVPPAARVAGEALPGFDVVRVNPQGDMVVAGRAEAGAVVIIRDGDVVVGEVTADARGEWVLVPETPLPPGSHRLELQMRTADRTEQASEDVIIVVPRPGEDVAGRPASAGTQALALRVPRSGGPATVLQRPGGDAAGAPLTVETADVDAEGRLALSGRAPPHARLRIVIDGKPAGDTTAGADGSWRFVPPGGLSAELHALAIEQRDAHGRLVAQARVPLALEREEASSIEAGRTLVVQRGQNLWRIARTAYGRGTSYTLIFDANRGDIVDPDLIYPGQVFHLPSAATTSTEN